MTAAFADTKLLLLLALAVLGAGTFKPAEPEDAKDSSTRRPIDVQMAVLTEQEKFLVREEQQMLEKFEARSKGTFELELRQQEINQEEQMLHRLRAEKVRLEIERLNAPPLIRFIQRAENPK